MGAHTRTHACTHTHTHTHHDGQKLNNQALNHTTNNITKPSYKHHITSTNNCLCTSSTVPWIYISQSPSHLRQTGTTVLRSFLTITEPHKHANPGSFFTKGTTSGYTDSSNSCKNATGRYSQPHLSEIL